MKKNILSALALCAVVGLSSCDSFLELEPLDKVSGDKLTETDGGMKALLATVYAAVPMEDFVFRPYTGFNARNYDGVNGVPTLLSFLMKLPVVKVVAVLQKVSIIGLMMRFVR